MQHQSHNMGQSQTPTALACLARMQEEIESSAGCVQTVDSDGVECSNGTEEAVEAPPDDEIVSTEGGDDSLLDKIRRYETCTWILWLLLVFTVAATGAIIVALVVTGLQGQSDNPSPSYIEKEYSTAGGPPYQTPTESPELLSRDINGDPLDPTQQYSEETVRAIVVPDPSVDYLYATAATTQAVNAIGMGDFTMSVHIMGTEDFPQAQHPTFLSNRQPADGGSDYFLFGIHEKWRGTANKIPYIQIGNVYWIQYDHPYQPNILDGVWHQFVARRKGPALSYFLDGVWIADLIEESIGSAIGSVSTYDEDQKLVLGCDLMNPSSTKFVGEMKELSVWNAALPVQDIATGLGSLVGDEDGLVAYFPIIPLNEFGEIISQNMAGAT